jgi:hypothetical protein
MKSPHCLGNLGSGSLQYRRVRPAATRRLPTIPTGPPISELMKHPSSRTTERPRKAAELNTAFPRQKHQKLCLATPYRASALDNPSLHHQARMRPLHQIPAGVRPRHSEGLAAAEEESEELRRCRLRAHPEDSGGWGQAFWALGVCRLQDRQVRRHHRRQHLRLRRSRARCL